MSPPPTVRIPSLPPPGRPHSVSHPGQPSVPRGKTSFSTTSFGNFGNFGAPKREAMPAASPLMAPLFWASSELLGLIPELTRGMLPPPQQLRHSLEGRLATMMERARSAGVVPEDIVDAQYALVAFIDEQLARANAWPGQSEWRMMPLQLVRFNENTAGETFFRRLALLESQPHRVHVMQIYFLCMALGFQGRFGVAGGQGFSALYDRVGARVAEAAGPDVLSPHGEPQERGFLRLEAPLVRLGLAILAVAIVLFLLLKIVVSVQSRSTSQRLLHFAGTEQAPPPPAKH